MRKYLEVFCNKQKEELSTLRNDKKFDKFSFGDTITVHYKNAENIRIDHTMTPTDQALRTQKITGVCISIKNNSLSSTFIVRVIDDERSSYQKSFMLYSPIIESIEVVKRGKVRRAKLNYIKTLYGKAARIKERKIVRSK